MICVFKFEVVKEHSLASQAQVWFCRDQDESRLPV
jgi:hypothetical protein